jgi:hypothetical protein
MFSSLWRGLLVRSLKPEGRGAIGVCGAEVDYLTISNLMCSRLQLAALGGLLLAALQTPRAETRSSVLQVRVNVVRACSIDARGAGEVSLTCTGARTAGVVTAGTGAEARIVPVPTRETTVVSAPVVSQSNTGPATATAVVPLRQVVTVNF